MSNRVTIVTQGDMCDTLSKFLSLSNITVLATGRNGKDAVDLYVKLKPDITIMDLNMPEYDGLYGLENIKKADPHAKVIIISANKDFNVKKRLEDLGCIAIIQDACEMDNMLNIIKNTSSNIIEHFVS